MTILAAARWGLWLAICKREVDKTTNISKLNWGNCTTKVFQDLFQSGTLWGEKYQKRGIG